MLRTKLELHAKNPDLRAGRAAVSGRPRLPALVAERPALAAVVLITLAGLGLRLYGLGHGLPYQYVPDESTMVGSALRMGASGSLQPPTFIYPAALMYLFAAEYLGLLVVGRIVGFFPSVAHFREFAFADPTLFYLLPRIAIALIGAATVPAIYAVGRRLYGRWAGVVAAGLLAASLMHVQMSHQARHWVPVTLLAVAVLWVSLDLAERGRRRDYLLAGLLVGLAAATSFNGFLLVVLPVAAHLVRVRGRRLALLDPRAHRWLAGTLILAPVVFFALNPYVLLNLGQFVAFHSSGEASIGGQIRGHYDNYLQQFLERQAFTFFGWSTLSYEPAITLLAIPGAVLAVRRYRATALVTLAYPLFHYLMFSTTAPSMEQRYMLPAIALMAVPAGLAGARGLAWLHGRLGSGRGKLSVATLALLLLALVAAPSLRYNWLLSQPDTRTLAKAWIESTIPAGADIAIQSYSPPLTPSLETLRAQQRERPESLGNRDLWILERGLPAGEVPYQLARLSLLETSPTVDNVTPYLVAHSHQYFVLSDFRWKSDHRGHQALKRYLAENGRLLTVISPSADAGYVPSDLLNNVEDPLLEMWRLERPGPLIAIYEVSR
jgi:4-amino-4-deoxy-L-arabinose transferase-like glycosyltransferase